MKGRTAAKNKEEGVGGQRRRCGSACRIGRCERVVVHCDVSTSPFSSTLDLSPLQPPGGPTTAASPTALPLRRLFNMEIDLNRSRDVRRGTRGQVPPVSGGEANERCETRGRANKESGEPGRDGREPAGIRQGSTEREPLQDWKDKEKKKNNFQLWFPGQQKDEKIIK